MILAFRQHSYSSFVQGPVDSNAGEPLKSGESNIVTFRQFQSVRDSSIRIRDLENTHSKHILAKTWSTFNVEYILWIVTCPKDKVI